jgi:enamine deaminase RidA (YjgF/YER057c/UK114 family)
MKHLLPEGWKRPKGYSNGIVTEGAQVYVAGMIGWDENQVLADGFVAQFRQALENTVAVLNEADAGPEHVVRMTWYVKGLDEYRNNLLKIGAAWRDVMGKSFPTMAVVGVTELVEKDALVEIETTAVVPGVGPA